MARPAAVLLDFSGTLFHVESAAEAAAAVFGDEGAGLVPGLERWAAINGGSGPADDSMPEHLHEVWRTRDLSAAAHRAAYSGLARHSGLDEDQAHRLYERGISPEAWQPYDDTVTVLRRLDEVGVPTAVVSNIGWDPRPVLAAAGVLDLIDVLVLSDERGLLKPDPEIFRLACRELGVAPADAVMVGDNPDADGAAVAVGCRFVLVPSDPPQRAPGTLLRAVGLDD